MNKKYIVEFVGTFALSFVVLLAVASVSLPLPVPVIAGLTLGLFVYTIGAISGCHINPAVTLAQWSVKKISSKDAGFYIVAQLLGAVIAVGIAKMLHIIPMVEPGIFSGRIFFAESLGAFFFNFGIAAVVYGKVKEQMSGLVVGASLLFGILVASFIGSLGILNPAVALALGAFSQLYILAPIVGAVLGFQAYKHVAGD